MRLASRDSPEKRYDLRVVRAPRALLLAAALAGASCATCHGQQADAWRTPHHALAMQKAGPGSVAGDFQDARYNGVVSTFHRQDGRYLVRTDGPRGTLQGFEVAYTFGVYPLAAAARRATVIGSRRRRTWNGMT